MPTADPYWRTGPGPERQHSAYGTKAGPARSCSPHLVVMIYSYAPAHALDLARGGWARRWPGQPRSVSRRRCLAGGLAVSACRHRHRSCLMTMADGGMFATMRSQGDQRRPPGEASSAFSARFRRRAGPLPPGGVARPNGLPATPAGTSRCARCSVVGCRANDCPSTPRRSGITLHAPARRRRRVLGPGALR